MKSVKNLTLTAMFFAIGLLLPFLTGQVPQIGSMLLPMHLPVFLCALICGWKYGVTMAMLLPITRSLIFTMPPLYPVAIAMTFELGTYALVAGLMYEKSRWQCVRALYGCIVTAMIAGRIVWGLMMALLMGIKGNTFTFQAFISGAVLNAIPGIIIQLILIPAIMVALDRAKLVPFRHEKKKAVRTAIDRG